MHVAIIMDGNGRWAEQRGLKRVIGHQAGARAVRKIVEAAARSAIDTLTLYADATHLNSYASVFGAGVWNHIVVSYDGSRAEADRFTVYLNGVATARTSNSGAIPTTISDSSPFTIGRYPPGNFQWDGQIGAVAVWTTGLPATESVALYNAGAGKFWTFN